MKQCRLVFLLIGQSNMAGRGPLDIGSGVTTPRVLRFAPPGAWEPAADPLHREASGAAGIGPGMSFAHAVAVARPDCEVGLVPCAVGNTPLARWEKSGDLFDSAVNQTLAALAGGSLTAILWHQGESDAMRVENAETYEGRLRDMIRDVRHSLGGGDTPFIAGELGPFLSVDKYPGAGQVNAALNLLSDCVPSYMCVPAAGLNDKGDGAHFDTLSQRELGRRYAAAFLRLSRIPEPQSS